ncbi:PorP/SprF family type IX secretion system membrane protein [Cecembia calidifontis]|jgi:type IX secretion system PorP/SprF family membrane protein|uniref:Type IX secretion system PorP/SprF family membrane protein n=1 Tax=Cecembia calidifontis TaxID=1187080 RepID=A0A4Q7P4W1_9BACT|nr:type IX secretion system membrane protein PorP/SprF [Cecembia calidifontis]RZS95036.1 type IX secretion system PorP/SprF family membrane protein [Cecembia calidifontis]
MKELKFLHIKFYSIFILSTGFLFSAKAQQDAQFTQYMYNGLFYNPAFAGKESGYQFSALHRTQWLNYTGTNGPAPITQLLTASGRIDQYNVGFGLTFVNDNIGPSNNQEINLAAAYHKKLGRGALSLGFSGGIFSSTLKYDELVVVNPDPRVPSSGRETQMNFNFGAGAIYDRGNYYIGLGSKHLNEPGFDFGDGSIDNQLKNHSYLLAGYRIKTFALWTFEPSFLIKTVSLNNFSYDLSVIATHGQRISGGLAFRGEESVSLLFGYGILRDNSLRLGYAFDLVFGGLEAKAPTSHEFMLTYNLKPVTREFQKVIQRTPRFRF